MQALPDSFPSTRSVTILGSTGSIGRSTVDLLLAHRDRFQVQALTANTNTALLAEQAKKLGARHAAIADKNLYADLKEKLAGTGVEVSAGHDAVIAAAGLPVDWTMAAIVGAAGIVPTLAAIRQGRTVALANKESLVSAGSLMMEAVTRAGTTLLPVDSEHNAVFQVLAPDQRDGLKRIILTASGGPFLNRSRAELDGITPEEAVRHPTWSMGAKISVDSATMMNKSLEIIEASYFFNLKNEQIDVLIHPQSVVHSMVEYVDGSILAQMGASDMRTPIAHTLGWPDRLQTSGQILDLNKKMNLSFEPIDLNRFTAIKIARDALDAGIGHTAVLNAANEIAVDAFLARRLKFSAIEAVADKVLQSADIRPISGIEDILEIDRDARRLAVDAVTGLQ
jgi:1-deoxy-D-xylulose-5-phosphate reductoisomerase